MVDFKVIKEEALQMGKARIFHRGRFHGESEILGTFGYTVFNFGRKGEGAVN